MLLRTRPVGIISGYKTSSGLIAPRTGQGLNTNHGLAREYRYLVNCSSSSPTFQPDHFHKIGPALFMFLMRTEAKISLHRGEGSDRT